MDTNAEALSYYWHLRAQEVTPDKARAHVRQRFGVSIGKLIPARDCVVATADPLAAVRTIFGTSTGPQDGLRRG